MPAATTHFDQAFEKNNQPGAPDWLSGLRTEGFNRFSSEGFPTRKNEEWKYTSLKPIQNRRFHLHQENEQVDLTAYADLLSPGHEFFANFSNFTSSNTNNVVDLPFAMVPGGASNPPPPYFEAS